MSKVDEDRDAREAELVARGKRARAGAMGLMDSLKDEAMRRIPDSYLIQEEEPDPDREVFRRLLADRPVKLTPKEYLWIQRCVPDDHDERRRLLTKYLSFEYLRLKERANGK